MLSTISVPSRQCPPSRSTIPSWGRWTALALLCLAAAPLTGRALFAQTSQSDVSGNLRSRAAAARDANDLARAVDLYEQALAATPDWLEGWWFLGNLQYAADHYDEARDALTHYIALAPKAPAALALRGLCEFETAAYAESLQDIQHALALGAADQSRNGQILLYHEALLLTRLGEFDQATSKYILFVKKDLINPDVETGLGLAGLRIPLLPKDISPADAPLVAQAGHAAVQVVLGDITSGRESFHDLLASYPGHANLHYFCGYLLFTTDPGAAVEEFQAELAVVPNSALAHGMLAWAHEFRGEYDAALPHAQAAVTADPASPIAQLVLGRALLESGKEPLTIAAALTHLDQVVQTDPSNLEAHLCLAKAYSRLGRKDDARRERLLALDLAGTGAIANANP